MNGLGSSAVFIQSTALSTTDSGASSFCVASPRYGSPWFHSGCCITCPTFASYYWSDEPHPMAYYLSSSTDYYGNLDSDVCPSGTALGAEDGSAFEGINSMDYYIR